MDGVLVVDKPEGLTSHDVVHRVRCLANTRRVGHLGTLDPMATGVLPLVLGKATRLANLLSAGDKVYDAIIKLGTVTDTYDSTGDVVATADDDRVAAVNDAAIEAVSRQFVGSFVQHPPPFSAKKIGGVRAYRLARRRQPVELRPVDVQVHELTLSRLDTWRLACRVICGPGFYVRSLAHDIGTALGPGACLETLRRLRSGVFTEQVAMRLERLEQHPNLAAEQLLGLGRLLPELTAVVVTERGRHLVAHGNTLGPEDIETRMEGTSGQNRRLPIKVCGQAGELLAIADETALGTLRPRIVLV